MQKKQDIFYLVQQEFTSLTERCFLIGMIARPYSERPGFPQHIYVKCPLAAPAVAAASVPDVCAPTLSNGTVGPPPVECVSHTAPNSTMTAPSVYVHRLHRLAVV